MSIGRTPLLEALYARVADMTIANGFYHDWQTQESIGNGSWITRNAAIHIRFGEEEPHEGIPSIQSYYKLEVPVFITGLKYKAGESDLKEIQFDLEIDKSKVIDDIRKAFYIAYDALCAAGGEHISYAGEVEVDDDDRGEYEVEATLQYRVRFEAEGSIG